jgi:hypothetical protein
LKSGEDIMGTAASVRAVSPDTAEREIETPPATTRELDVDDVRLLLEELRLRRRLRAQD